MSVHRLDSGRAPSWTRHGRAVGSAPLSPRRASPVGLLLAAPRPCHTSRPRDQARRRTMKGRGTRRREFVKASAAAAAGLVFVKPGSVYGTPANDAIALGIIGCGGRGSGVGRDFLNAGGARRRAARPVRRPPDRDARAARQGADEKGLPKIADGMLFKGPDAYRKLLAAPAWTPSSSPARRTSTRTTSRRRWRRGQALLAREAGGHRRARHQADRETGRKGAGK